MSSSSSSFSPSLVIDTHCHLEYVLTQRGNTDVPVDAFLPDWLHCVTVFCDAAAVSPSLGIFDQLLSHPRVYGAFGCHPRNAFSWTPMFRERVESALSLERAVAWGECGLDYSRLTADNTRDVQIACFREQVQRAVELGFPIVVHARGAFDDTFNVLAELCPPTHRIHMHAFSGTVTEALRYLEHFANLFIGFTGAVTFSGAQGDALRLVCKAVPLSKLVIETDAPYMKPVEDGAAKKKKKRNTPSTPADVLDVAKAVAALKEIAVEELLAHSNANARALYGLDRFFTLPASSSASSAPPPAAAESDRARSPA